MGPKIAPSVLAKPLYLSHVLEIGRIPPSVPEAKKLLFILHATAESMQRRTVTCSAIWPDGQAR